MLHTLYMHTLTLMLNACNISTHNAIFMSHTCNMSVEATWHVRQHACNILNLTRNKVEELFMQHQVDVTYM